MRPGVFEVRGEPALANERVDEARLADVGAPGEGDLERPAGGRNSSAGTLFTNCQRLLEQLLAGRKLCIREQRSVMACAASRH